MPYETCEVCRLRVYSPAAGDRNPCPRCAAAPAPPASNREPIGNASILRLARDWLAVLPRQRTPKV
jgi:hypothetical protein